MSWGLPAAWFGLTALAVPLLVHLLARRTTRRLAFPTLRFIDPSRLSPTRRRRFTDRWFMAVRMAIVAAAVAALAQPRIETASRRTAAAGRVVRAVVVDTSASMQAPTADGRPGVDTARADASTLAGTADLSRVIESDMPAAALDGAAAWLAARGGTRELVVVSDFQAGVLTGADLRRVPEGIGLRFVPVDVERPAPREFTVTLGGLETASAVSPGERSTTIAWRTRPIEMSSAGLTVETADAEADAAHALLRAARQLSRPGPAGGRTIVLLPGAPDRAAWLAAARLVDAPWMFDAIEVIRRDDAVRDAAAGADPDVTPAGSLTPVVSSADGRPLVEAGAVDSQGGGLLLAVHVGLEHALTAAVLAAAPAGGAPGAPVSEADPRRIDDATLRTWARQASPAPATAADRRGASDGRWFWLLALALVAVETWMRRRSPASATTLPGEASRARVA